MRGREGQREERERERARESMSKHTRANTFQAGKKSMLDVLREYKMKLDKLNKVF